VFVGEHDAKGATLSFEQAATRLRRSSHTRTAEVGRQLDHASQHRDTAADSQAPEG
jgi:hypothetical protein